MGPLWSKLAARDAALRDADSWIEHNWRVLDRLHNLNLLIMDAEIGVRGYFVSENKAYLGPLTDAPGKIAQKFERLRPLISDNPIQTSNLEQLHELFARKLESLQGSVKLYEESGLSAVLKQARLDKNGEVMDEIRFQIVFMAHEESELLAAHRSRFYRQARNSELMGIAINGIAMLVLILFYHLIGRNFSQRLLVEDALKRTNDNLETTVEARTRQLSLLSRHLINVAEKEKSRLSRELHDELGANLTAINMDLVVTMEKLKASEPALAARLGRARVTLLHTVDIKRRIIENLRPSMLDHLGLPASIEDHCDEFARRTGIACRVDLAEDIDDLDPMWAITVFRIVQESPTNVAKYAQDDAVEVSLRRQDDGLRFRIADDGNGLDPDALSNPKSHGLLGMRERALLLGGSFSARRDDDGRGTVIEAFIPFKPWQDGQDELGDAAEEPPAAREG